MLRVTVPVLNRRCSYHREELHKSSTTHSEAPLGLLLFSPVCLQGRG